VSAPRKGNDPERRPVDTESAGVPVTDTPAPRSAPPAVSDASPPAVPHASTCDFRTVCPNCGAAMHDRGCKTRCPRCHYFTDCSDPW
jgi:hypothetical protein